MSSSTSAKNRPGNTSGRPIKKKLVKPGSRSRTKSAPPPTGGYEKYSGLETIKARPEADRRLPIGSQGKKTSDFRKYGSLNRQNFQLDDDLSWPDARKAAGILMKAVPPLTADLNVKQKIGYEHLITDLLFHAPKLGHEILTGGEGPYAGLNLKNRTYFNTGYGAQMAVSGHAMRTSNGDFFEAYNWRRRTSLSGPSTPSYDATSDIDFQVFVRRRYLFSTTFQSFCTTRVDKAGQNMSVSC